eukprot:1741969-Amphidinium_carterae.1
MKGRQGLHPAPEVWNAARPPGSASSRWLGTLADCPHLVTNVAIPTLTTTCPPFQILKLLRLCPTWFFVLSGPPRPLKR